MVELVNPLNAYRDSYSLLEGMAQDRAKRTAGNALAKGDYGTAQNALYSRGMLNEGAAVGTMQQNQQATQAKMSAAQAKEAQDRLAWTGKALDGLSQIQDPAQRKAAYIDHLRPVLAQMGVPQDELAKIDASDFSDATLQQWKAVTGEQAQKLQIIASGGGGYNAVDPTTGKPVYTQGPSVIDPTKTYVDYGTGQPAPAAPAPPATPAAAPTPASDPSQAGSDAYLARLAQVESSGNPNAKNGSSTGLYQFHPDTFARLGGTDINDPAQQKDAALKLAQESAQTLQGAGVPVDDANLYIMHQQGSGGGLALLTAPPETNAIATLTPVYGNPTRARQAIVNNGGTPDMTAGQFVQMWRQKWGQGAQQAQAQPYQVAANGDTPPPPSNVGGFNLPAGARVIHAAAPKVTNLPSGYEPDPAQPGHIRPIPGGPADTGAAGAAPGDATLSGPAYLKSLPPPIASQVKALAEGRMEFPKGTALKSPHWQMMVDAVAQYDPNFDTGMISTNTRAKTRTAFTSGPESRNITSFNTAIGHLGSMAADIQNLHNTDIPAINWAKNGIANATGQPQVVQFNAEREAVASEMTRAFRGTGGNESDVQAWRKLFNSANSETQLRAAIKKAVELLDSRISALGQRYNEGMGTTRDPLQLLDPKSAQVLRQLRQYAGGDASGNAPSPTPDVIRYDAQGRRIK